jgi:hypothetical protein
MERAVKENRRRQREWGHQNRIARKPAPRYYTPNIWVDSLIEDGVLSVAAKLVLHVCYLDKTSNKLGWRFNMTKFCEQWQVKSRIAAYRSMQRLVDRGIFRVEKLKNGRRVLLAKEHLAEVSK